MRTTKITLAFTLLFVVGISLFPTATAASNSFDITQERQLKSAKEEKGEKSVKKEKVKKEKTVKEVKTSSPVKKKIKEKKEKTEKKKDKSTVAPIVSGVELTVPICATCFDAGDTAAASASLTSGLQVAAAESLPTGVDPLLIDVGFGESQDCIELCNFDGSDGRYLQEASFTSILVIRFDFSAVLNGQSLISFDFIASFLAVLVMNSDALDSAFSEDAGAPISFSFGEATLTYTVDTGGTQSPVATKAPGERRSRSLFGYVY